MKLRYVGLAACLGILGSQSLPVRAQLITESFDDVSTLPGKGWNLQNNSTAAFGTWFQGTPGTFTAQSGASNSYIATNYLNTSAPGGTLSNWLIAPSLSISPSGTVSFYTRTNGITFPDRLEVRYSTGTGADVGADANSVGTFTTLLGTINPNLLAGSANYPNTWTQFTFNIPVAATETGRVAFRYFVTNGGVGGANSDYIGLDTVAIQGAASATPAPGSVVTGLMGLTPLASFALRRRRAAKK